MATLKYLHLSYTDRKKSIVKWELIEVIKGSCWPVNVFFQKLKDFKI